MPDSLQELIAQNKIEEALALVSKKELNAEQEITLTNLRRRFNQVRTESQRGVQNQEQINQERNQIAVAIWELNESLHKTKIEPEPAVHQEDHPPDQKKRSALMERLFQWENIFNKTKSDIPIIPWMLSILANGVLVAIWIMMNWLISLLLGLPFLEEMLGKRFILSLELFFLLITFLPVAYFAVRDIVILTMSIYNQLFKKKNGI